MYCRILSRRIIINGFSRPLGDTVKKARTELGLTQVRVADQINIDAYTVINIENDNAHPKMEVLYPLVRTLKVDPWDIFYPEMQHRNSAFRQLQILLKDCSDEEIESLLPICRTTLSVLRAKDSIKIE